MLELCREAPQPSMYKGGSRRTYNIFIRQCQKNFAFAGITNDQPKINYGACFLSGTPDDRWDAFVKHHDDPKSLTWEDFKTKIFFQPGDAKVIMEKNYDEYQRAKQGNRETVLQYSCRLDRLCEEMDQEVEDEERLSRLLSGLKDSIKYNILSQPFLPSTHVQLLGQAQRIESNEIADAKRKQGSVPHHHRRRDSQSKRHRGGRGGFRGRGRGH